jgi:16S rRNA (cytosine967-C5)-methyltransferase
VPWSALPEALALSALANVLGGHPAEREIDRALRSRRDLSAEERAAFVEAVFGVALWRRRLAWHARSTDPAALLQALIRDLGGHGVPLRRGEPDRLADRWSLPGWLEAHLEAELGVEAEAFCAAVAEPGPICLRANRLLCTREMLAARLSSEGIETEPGDRAPDALLVRTPRANLFGSSAWRDGWFEPQDEGSQLVGLLARGEEVLDLCAGAGGKSLLLAAGGARVLAYDVDTGRVARLRSRAARAKASIEVLERPRAAETVLVDAPCSEIGTLRRGPDLRWRIDPLSLVTLPALQREILQSAAPLALRRLVYVTCTLNRAENEEVASSFERAHPELRRTETLVLLPHRDGADGFFAACWQRA